MIVKRPQLDRALRAAAATPLFLLYGPEESGSRALVPRIAAALGDDAERIDLGPYDLRPEPTAAHSPRLADEAAAFSMFGGARYIVVERAGDDTVPAVEALLDAAVRGNPVILLAGDLKKTSKLLELVGEHPAAVAFASYPASGRDGDTLVDEAARSLGLQPSPGVAARIAADCAGSSGIIFRELEKYAAFLDAAPNAPKPLEHDTLDAVGADVGEGDLSRLLAAVAGGDPDRAEAELGRLRAEGKDGIQLIRAALRRMTMLARLRAEVERGKSVSAVMASAGKSIFFKEQGAVQAELGRWRAETLAKAVSRLIEAEKQVMLPGGPGPVAAEAELLAIARQAARRR